MKKFFFLIMISVIAMVFPAFGQVGINTENPLATLDINGNLRVRKITDNASAQKILVLGSDSIVYTNTPDKLFPGDTLDVKRALRLRNTQVNTLSRSLLLLDENNIVRTNTIDNLAPAGNPKSFVRGSSGTDISLLNISLLTGWYKIAMSGKAFDENNDYNTTTSEFTAPVDGIYNIYVQFRMKSVISGGEIGVGIFRKPKGASAFTLVAEETYFSLNVSVLIINLDVSPPTRSTQTMLKLNAGDVIIFGARVPLLSASLLGGSNTYFTINQLK